MHLKAACLKSDVNIRTALEDKCSLNGIGCNMDKLGQVDFHLRILDVNMSSSSYSNR